MVWQIAELKTNERKMTMVIVTDKEFEERALQMGVEQEAAEALRRAMELRKVFIIFSLIVIPLIVALSKIPW
jgi:hypothetical protein